MAQQPVNMDALQEAINAQNRAQVAQHLKTSITDADVKAFVAKQIANQLTPVELQNATQMSTAQLLDYIRQNIL